MFYAIVVGYNTCSPEGKETSALAIYLASGLDVLAGITTLVVGILSLTAPHLGIALSPAAQWALIGVGATYTGFMLLTIVNLLKLSVPSFRYKYFC